jgi:hypothetical protein
MSDEYLVSFLIPPSVNGLLEGLDPALNDNLFPITAAQDLLNVRVADGRWRTRAGSALFYNFAPPHSGETRLFDVLYEADGSRFRLIARGADNAAALFDHEESVDSAWVAVSGGTGLGTTTSTQPYFNGTQVGESYYFTDRFGALRKYVPATGVASVTIPAVPGTAPRTKAWTYGILEKWEGAAPYGWTESDGANFSLSTSGSIPNPMGGITVNIAITSSADNDTITDDVSGEELNSHTIAFWYRSTASLQKHIQFGFGLAAADEYVTPLKAPVKQNWYPVFVQVGDLPSINRKRLKCIRALATQNFQVTRLFLPGRLEGEYCWSYTHYNPTTGHESGLSPLSNGGVSLDFSTIGQSYSDDPSTTKAFQKSCMLDFTSDSGTDAATTKIRIYRSGGVPELTIGEDGRRIWLRVGEINDQSTLLNGAHLAADTTLAVDSHSGFATGDWIVIAKGGATEEYQKVTNAAANVLTVTPGLVNNQSDDATIQIAFLDNVPNEAIDVLNVVDEERDSPPSGSHWVSRSPDGRIWLAGPDTRVRVSNRATPLRPNDYECFPDGVDPQTRANPLQGWGFEVGGDTTGEQIVWAGFFRGLYHILTRNKMFRVHAQAQTDWGANAIQKVLDVGCIGGETVQQEGGYLYWVSEGPRVVRWAGEGPVEVLSAQKVNVRLEAAQQNAGTTNSTFWFARIHENVFGRYYSLWFNYSSTDFGNLSRVDWNITQQEWEACRWQESNGDPTPWNAARVWDGGTDQNELIGVSYRGAIVELDNPSLSADRGVAIPVSFKTKRIPFGFVGEPRECYIRLTGATDEATLTVTCGGSDYGTTTATYEVDLSGSGDQDIRVPIERTLKGRWCELTLAGNFSNRPAVREMVLQVRPIRERTTAADG